MEDEKKEKQRRRKEREKVSPISEIPSTIAILDLVKGEHVHGIGFLIFPSLSVLISGMRDVSPKNTQAVRPYSL